VLEPAGDGRPEVAEPGVEDVRTPVLYGHARGFEPGGEVRFEFGCQPVSPAEFCK
jgi:hypothetical protein